jgi:hypothetical protein
MDHDVFSDLHVGYQDHGYLAQNAQNVGFRDFVPDGNDPADDGEADFTAPVFPVFFVYLVFLVLNQKD